VESDRVRELILASHRGDTRAVEPDVLDKAAVPIDQLEAKLEEEHERVESKLPGERRSLSAELLHALHRPPKR
jgi:hypothetical protein